MKNFVKEKISETAKQLKNLSVLEKEKLTGFQIIPTGYKKEALGCPVADDSWDILNYGDIIKGIDTHFWIYKRIKTPKRNTEHERVYFDLDLWYDAQWLVYLDGQMYQNLDGFHRDTQLEFDREYDLHIYMYAHNQFGGNTTGNIYFKPSFKRVDSKIEQLYYDINVPLLSLDCLKEDDDNAVITKKYLECACNMLDLRIPYSNDFYHSIDEAVEFLKDEYYEKVCGKSDAIVSCVGHSHIDLAWKWTLAQTEEKVQRTFSTALRLMEEYNEYVFTASQVPLYKFAKTYAPELYERVKQKIKQGKFEPEGAMYVEADCNLTSGESLIRQILFGKRFFKEELGIESKVLWLPDVFGYSSALPQILKKSGVEKFVTSKISWNETNMLPYDVFMWEGIDGTEIFTTFITGQNYTPDKLTIHTDYNGELTPKMVMGARKRFQQKEYSNRGFITFGYGDGGGGTPRWMIENHRRLKYGLPGLPKTEIEGVGSYLEKLYKDFIDSSNKLKKCPRWVGELYLEFHRGTYTSMAKNKKNNRKSEFLLQLSEQLCTTCKHLLGGEYPQDKINSAWELMLLNQFHDIIPGSAIDEVYHDSDVHYAKIYKTGNDINKKMLSYIAGAIDKNQGTVVYNPNSFDVNGYVMINGKTAYVENVPSTGWITVKEPDYSNSIKLTQNCIENKLIIVKFDSCGNINSIYDKQCGREIIAEGKAANVIEAFEDLPYQYDNWEISDYYKQKKWNVDDLTEMKPIIDGARSGFKIVRKFLNSEIIQKIWVYENSKKIDFETDIDWKESHIVLKAAFPVNVHTDKAVYETQFGYVERPTHQNTSWDAAKFEVCAHKYADISEDDYGAAILNDCKYGHNAEGNTIKITLLKCGTFPNENADKEKHRFLYSFMPHSGNHTRGGVVQEAYKLNRPLCALAAKGNGNIASDFSLVRCDKENIIIETIKKAENSDGTVIRAYDAYKRRGTVTFTFGYEIKKAYLCDMMENKIAEIQVKANNMVSVEMSAFEIITILTE